MLLRRIYENDFELLSPQTTFPCFHSSGINWSHPELHLRIRSERFPQHDRCSNIQPFLAIIAQPDNHQLTTAQLSSIARGSDRTTQTQPTSFGGSYFKHCCSRLQFKRDISTKKKKRKRGNITSEHQNVRLGAEDSSDVAYRRCCVHCISVFKYVSFQRPIFVKFVLFQRLIQVCVQVCVVSTACLKPVFTCLTFLLFFP